MSESAAGIAAGPQHAGTVDTGSHEFPSDSQRSKAHDAAQRAVDDSYTATGA